MFSEFILRLNIYPLLEYWQVRDGVLLHRLSTKGAWISRCEIELVSHHHQIHPFWKGGDLRVEDCGGRCPRSPHEVGDRGGGRPGDVKRCQTILSCFLDQKRPGPRTYQPDQTFPDNTYNSNTRSNVTRL